MTYGNDKVDFFVINRYATASGANDSMKLLIRHEGRSDWKVYSVAHDSGVGGSSLPGSTWTPDLSSGYSTLVGSQKSRFGAIKLARKTAEALNLGRVSK
jgi:hypothetical protein